MAKKTNRQNGSKKRDKTHTVSLGHLPHMTGGGAHDSRPRGQRDRQGVKRAAIADQGQ